LKSEIYQNFIELWGSMGVLWGINRSMARIHAFILISEEPVDLDIIANELNISRGNASMCLKELRNIGIIHRVNISGDRRDFFKIEPDMWKMLFKIVAERKKREFDPALNSLRILLAEGETENDKLVHDRMLQIEKFLSSFDRIGNIALEDEKKSKSMFDLMNSFFHEKEKF
jgi:HTH-type transcriptional regulator, glycine betaine synthesis regulator